MIAQLTEITLTNEDGDCLRIRVSEADNDVAEISIPDERFWFPLDEWSEISSAVEKICGKVGPNG